MNTRSLNPANQTLKNWLTSSNVSSDKNHVMSSTPRLMLAYALKQERLRRKWLKSTTEFFETRPTIMLPLTRRHLQNQMNRRLISSSIFVLMSSGLRSIFGVCAQHSMGTFTPATGNKAGIRVSRIRC